MSRNLATLIGVSAIIMWSSVMGLIKKVSMLFGPSLGITLIYSLSAIILYPIFGFPNLKNISKIFLLITTTLFVLYEILFSYAIGLSTSEQQAIEVSIIHYLWPTFTVFAFIIIKELNFRLIILIGLAISVFGVIYMQIGDRGFDFNIIASNVASNPIVYILALTAAIVWSMYCAITKKYTKGAENPIALYFFILSLVLWAKFLYKGNIDLDQLSDMVAWIYVLMAGVGVGLGYAAWNIGVLRGNLQILVISSYFIPILASMLAVYILDAQLSSAFWLGTLAVTIGSLICWFATRSPRIINK